MGLSALEACFLLLSSSYRVDRKLPYAVVTSMFPLASIYFVRCFVRGSYIPRWSAPCRGTRAVTAGMLLPVVPSIAVTVVVSSVAVLSGLHTLWLQIKLHSKAPVTQPVQHNTKAEEGDLEDEPVGPNNVHVASEDADGPLPEDPEFVEFMARFRTTRDQVLLFVIGTVGSFMSVMTSSGGPFCIIPLLFLSFGHKVPSYSSVALSWTAGIVICGTLAVIAGLTAELDLGLALVTFVSLQVSVPLGMKMGRSMNKNALRTLIGCILLVLGIYSFVRLGTSIESDAPVGKNRTKSDGSSLEPVSGFFLPR